LEYAVMVVDLEYVNGLMVLAYLMSGTVGIALLSGWALKRFGRPQLQRTRARSRRRF
jgi:hypothetical protein